MELQDLRERMDASFGTGPEHLPVGETIRSGRRALLRRKVFTAAGAAAVVALLVAAPMTLSDDSASSDPIEQPTETATTSSIRQPLDLPVDTSWQDRCGAEQSVDCQQFLQRNGPMTYLTDGTLAVVSPDVDVWERIDDPLDIAGGESAAVETVLNGSIRWWLVALTPDGRVVTRELDPSGYDTDFETWAGTLRDLAQSQGRLVPRIPQSP